MEFWTSGFSAPRGIVHVARDAEAQGWDGLSVVDSQNLSGDSFVALTMAATATERLKLGTGVTNSITRNAATLATAIASVHSVFRGRAVLGIGRGICRVVGCRLRKSSTSRPNWPHRCRNCNWQKRRLIAILPGLPIASPATAKSPWKWRRVDHESLPWPHARPTA
ncbi:hypothetical protein C2W62_29815 [Candidatus Entotheonella serta]|nr:hypothetical protein C2W62_29815 [Candidatus Entotheonella serta]